MPRRIDPIALVALLGLLGLIWLTRMDPGAIRSIRAEWMPLLASSPRSTTKIHLSGTPCRSTSLLTMYEVSEAKILPRKSPQNTGRLALLPLTQQAAR